MSDTTNPLSGLKPDASIDDVASHLFPDEPAGGTTRETTSTPDPTPAAAQPSAPAATQGEAPASKPTPSRKIRLKEDDVETDLDLDEYVSDDTKRTELQKWLQTGRQHDKLVERRVKAKEQEVTKTATEWIQSLARDNGYEIAYDPTTQKYRFVASNGVANQPRAAAATSPDSDPDAEVTKLSAEVEKLRKTARETQYVDDFVALTEASDKLSEARLRAQAARLERKTSDFEKWRAAQEQQQAIAAQAAQQQRLVAEATAAANDVFSRHPDVFEAYTPEQRQAIMREEARGVDDVATFRARLEARAATDRARFQAWAKRLNGAAPRAPAPAAPPVHSGASPAAGGATASKKDFSTLDAGWEKNLIPD